MDHRFTARTSDGIGRHVGRCVGRISRMFKRDADGVPANVPEQGDVALAVYDEAAIGARGDHHRGVLHLLAAVRRVRDLLVATLDHAVNPNSLDRLMALAVQHPAFHPRGNILRRRCGFAAREASGSGGYEKERVFPLKSPRNAGPMASRCMSPSFAGW